MKLMILLFAVMAAGLLVGLLLSTGPAQAILRANGKIAFTSNRDGNVDEIYLMNADGSGQTNLTNNPALDSFPAHSPDGTKIAFMSRRSSDSNAEIYVMKASPENATTNVPQRLTNNLAFDSEPAFSLDGSKIAFRSNRDGNEEVYVMDTNPATDDAQNLTNNAALDAEPVFSPDGTKIAFTSNRDGDQDVYVMDTDPATNDAAINLTNGGPGFDNNPAFSIDGKKITFRSDRHGNAEIYVMNASPENATTNVPQRLTNNAALDVQPVFSPDGTKIAFASNRDGLELEVYWMSAKDGSKLTRLTNNAARDFNPEWGARTPSRVP